MKISEKFELIGTRDGLVITVINGSRAIETDAQRINDCEEIFKVCYFMDENKRESWLNEQIASGKYGSLFGDK